MKDDIRVPGETTDMPLTTDTLHHMKCIKYTMPWAVIELTNFVMVIDTDCISIYKSIWTQPPPKYGVIKPCSIRKHRWFVNFPFDLYTCYLLTTDKHDNKNYHWFLWDVVLMFPQEILNKYTFVDMFQFEMDFSHLRLCLWCAIAMKN